MSSPYAFYIWSAYSVSLISLAAVTMWVLRDYRKAKAQLAQLGDSK